ncbi:hypothetical protein CW306_00595 [Bacillus sp. BA3]|uniref:DUF1643 domain-containing protein n=1 Tax=Bacillus sp. BA3 TaxID=2057910 RepID=UPI000C34B3F0|nr:DUF1643 domain-containing protein [Bacillus sp. BA3]PKF90070.1 hypothetical protein CW306_00595 [Bacillus sp. BA3]
MPPRDYPISKVTLPAEVHPVNTTYRIRESIKITLNNNYSSRITFIMMNPAFANDNQSDDTVNGIINFIFNNSIQIVNTNENIVDVGFLNVVNLFSIYNRDSRELWDDLLNIRSNNQLGEEEFKTLLDNNINTINNVINNHSDYIVLAWGLPNDIYISLALYYRQIFEIQKIVKHSGLPIFVPQTNNRPYLSKQETPFHPNKKRLTGLVKVEINNLNEIIPL